ncbi:hypothetical protein Vadar_027746 [Vaccinium darrowii]|uniref:Uncharacterized protein n=1 Tax=Vaccinium darrowii TaxID=229202 RepID=A0ACB7XKE3_9ERIC|nr:hypothetical protein Vadar_027746 [Vaccinium darrowii]
MLWTKLKRKAMRRRKVSSCSSKCKCFSSNAADKAQEGGHAEKEKSRLACQVIARPELDGMRLAVPAATRNFAVDGYKPKPHLKVSRHGAGAVMAKMKGSVESKTINHEAESDELA